MKKAIGDERLMVKVCNLYYKDDLKQEEIAKKLCLSRPTISRILKEAKQLGIVKIEIVSPFIQDYNSLEKSLEKKFGLKEVIIVDDNEDYSSQKEELGLKAAAYLERTLQNSDIVGISMGTTLKEIAKFVKSPKETGATFVPLIGGVGQLGIDIHPNQILLELAKAFSGDFRLLHAPAVVSDPSIIANFKEEKSIKSVLEYIDKVTVAVIGIGVPIHKSSTMIATGYYNESEIEVLKKKKAVGDICLQSFDTRGNTSQFEANKNVFGIDIERLKTIDKVIGIAGGEAKVEAIKGAINGKYINVLITNYSCGLELQSNHKATFK